MVPAKGKHGHVSKGKGAAGSGRNVAGAAAKLKDVKKEKTSESEDSAEESVSLPDLRIIDQAKHLPRFTSVLSKPEENGVTMEDLDALQNELETMLNAVVLRSINLQKEIAGMTEKPSSPGKRSKQEDRSPKKFKDQQGRARDTLTPPLLTKTSKIKSVTIKAGDIPPATEEAPTENLRGSAVCRNDTPNKFWASVEPYCAAFTEEDLKLIAELVANANDDEEYLKIPPLGRHYTQRWAEDDLHQEQREGSRYGDKKKTTTNSSPDDAQRMLDSVTKITDGSATPALCGPITQRLISALMEENIVTSLQDTMDTEAQDENVKSAGAKTSSGAQNAALERRIRQELEEQGLLAAEERSNVNETDDEILTELRRCQGELRAISQHNFQQLNKLHRMALDEMKRQEVRKKLAAADNEVVDIYRKMAAAKQKKRPITKKEKDQAWKVLRDREAIVKQLDTNATTT